MDPIKVQYKFKTAQAKFDVDYDVCFNGVEKEIRLPGFHAPDDASVTWCVKITPEKASFETPTFRFLTVFLSFESVTNEDLLIRPKLTVSQTSNFSRDDYIIKHGHVGVNQDSFKASMNWACLVKQRSSSMKVGKIAYINDCNNLLTIDATIRYCEDSDDKYLYDVKGLPREPTVPFAGEKCVIDSLAALLASGEQADATLVVDGEELPTHRLILSLQSDVFKAMFSTACTEKDSGRVVVKDMGVTVVKQLLRFLYTGSVDADLDSLPELLVAADKYMVAGLRELCQHRLENALRLQGAPPAAPGTEDSSVLLCDSLRVAFLVDCASLRQVAVDHLRGHPELVRTPAWAELTAGPHRAAAALALLDAMEPAAGRSDQ